MRKFLITLTVILVLSCSGNQTPGGIMTEKEMTPILVEIHLAEGIYSQRYVQKITRDNYQEDLYLSVLKKFKCNQKVFEASLLYYGKYPEKYKLIYDEVLNRLNEMQVKSLAKDSLQRVKR
jgi:hypothetical protein